MSDAMRRDIQATDFEHRLEGLLQDAELQAQLNQAQGDQDKWEYWVKSWVALSRAANAIKFGSTSLHWQEIWQEHRRKQAPSP